PRPLPLHQPGSIELLAYLVTRPNRPVEQVRAALDPDSDLPEFRRRFHAMRADLERAAPGLRIAHETSSRTYRVDLDGPELDWDAHRLFALLRPGPTRDPAAALDAYHGPFLPDATSEWSRAARVTLDSQVLAAGLEAAGERYSSGQHEGALQLAERLLEHWPLDERAARLYLRATARARGTAAAAQAAARLRAGGLDSAVVDALERELLQPN
ncbi:MAG TPA: BTAD domain-containing putative transcriptional regulator, partial [Deinococcales bacterium]|nr:BTAD domain-containing putative transcriptional regulator [Deinococcales bacterium]